jgi:uncharacterized protein YjcR
MRRSKYGVNITEAAQKLGITVRTIHKRIESGWDIEDAISTPYVPHKNRVGFGNKKYEANIKYAAEKLGLTAVNIYQRLGRGWPLDKAISTPNLKKKKKEKVWVYKPNEIYSAEKPQKPVDCCNNLKKSLSNLYGTIDKILQSKIAMRKLAKLPELAEHFTTLSKADNEAIDEAIGGIKVYILNNPKPDKEFIYNVVGTDGQNLHTNDKAEFMAFMAEVA